MSDHRPRSVWQSRLRVADAMLLLTTARMIRATVPMSRWQCLVGRKAVPTAAANVNPAEPKGVELDVSLAIERGAERLPFQTTCLDQAVAGQWMLAQRHNRGTLVIGLLKTDPSGGIHAWLIGANGGVVTGADEASAFAAVTYFR